MYTRTQSKPAGCNEKVRGLENTRLWNTRLFMIFTIVVNSNPALVSCLRDARLLSGWSHYKDFSILLLSQWMPAQELSLLKSLHKTLMTKLKKTSFLDIFFSVKRQTRRQALQTKDNGSVDCKDYSDASTVHVSCTLGFGMR